MREFFRFCIDAIKLGGFAPMTVFIIHVIASKGFQAYHHFSMLDIPMHFVGGVVICFFFWRSFSAPNVNLYLGTHTRFSLFVMLMALTASATVLWEFAEWVNDIVFGGTAQVSITDTMGDMFLGLLGGACIAIRAATKH